MVGVTLGMPGPWADNNYEVAGMYTTKIGGLPDWPSPLDCVNPELLKCTKCSSQLCLLAQVYAPLSLIDERTIYVFGCVDSDCASGTWRALRVQRISTDEAAQETLNSNAMLDDGVDDHAETEDLDLDDLITAFSEVATITKKKKPSVATIKKPQLDRTVRCVDDGTPVLPCFYIYTQEERVNRRIVPENSTPSVDLSALDMNPEDNPDEASEEVYEYDRALNADRSYLKFKKRIDAYPEQCIRYGGDPLLPTSETGYQGACNICGRAQQFEMQLMSPIIYFLQEETDEPLRTALEKHDWTTLLVYTCPFSCSDAGFSSVNSGGAPWTVAEEAVVVQRE